MRNRSGIARRKYGDANGCCILLAWTVVLLTAGGCQQYQAKPLDIENYRDRWSERSPAGDEVATFLEQIESRAPLDAPFDMSDGISLREAEVIALVFNSRLRQSRTAARVAAAEAEFAGLWEDPVFDLDVLKIVESVPEPWIIGTAIGFTIPLSGRLEVEKERASAEEFAALSRVARTEWEVVNDLRSAWLEWSAHQHRIEVVDGVLTRLQAIVKTIDDLEQAGEQSRIESRLFHLEAVSRRAELLQLEMESEALRYKVIDALGLRPESAIDLVAELAAIPEHQSEGSDLEVRMLDTNPALAVARAEYAVAELELNREIRKQYPDLGIGPAYENEDDQSRVGFIASFPIPIINRNRQGIASAEARREEARVAAESMYERLVTDLHQARSELARRGELLQYLEQTLVPMVDEQADDVRTLLDLGEVNTVVQLESLVREAEAKLDLIDVQLSAAQSALRVRSILGPETTNQTDEGVAP